MPEPADDSRLRRISRGTARVSTTRRRETLRSPRACRSLLAPLDVRLDDEWGLDHGTWAVLCHVYPQADVPIVQLAIDGTQAAAISLRARTNVSRALRDEGIMLVGSGNVVHNLRVMRRGDGARAYPGPLQFNEAVRGFLSRNEHAPLVDYHLLGEPALCRFPTPEHYLPMLYIAGARREDDEFSVITDGIDLASVSMLSFRTIAIGATEARS